MAQTSSKLSAILILSLHLVHLASGSSPIDDLSPSRPGLQEKVTNMHFYSHDIFSGKDPTAVKVIESPSTKNSVTGFGMVAMFDDPLTEGPETTSKLVGRAQGLYAQVSQHGVGPLMAFNYVFVEGEYNGSSLTVLGRNQVFSSIREMPVSGGTGIFRLAQGYALARTHSYDLTTGDAVVEYNVTVFRH